MKRKPQYATPAMTSDQTAMSPSVAAWVVAGLALFAVVAVILLTNRREPVVPPAPESAAVVLHTGDSGWLGKAGDNPALAARTVWDMEQAAKSVAANDGHGLRELFTDGRVWEVPAGTRVRLIDRGPVVSEVRFLNGNDTGRAGYVLTKAVVAE